MEEITTIEKCPNWEQFLFYHQEKSKYKVLLPMDSKNPVLYLSSHTIFCLRKGGFSLLLDSRSNYKEKNNIDTFDFSSNGYSSQEVIEFFFLVTFPKDVLYIIEPFDSIMLAHIYTIRLAKKIMKYVNLNLLSLKNTDKMFYSWKFTALCQIIKVSSLKNIFSSQNSVYLLDYPYTLYKFNKDVDIESLINEVSLNINNVKYMPITTRIIINCWKNDDVVGLHDIEMRKDKYIVSKNGEEYLTLENIIKQLRLNILLERDLLLCQDSVNRSYHHECINRGFVSTHRSVNENMYNIDYNKSLLTGINMFISSQLKKGRGINDF